MNPLISVTRSARTVKGAPGANEAVGSVLRMFTPCTVVSGLSSRYVTVNSRTSPMKLSRLCRCGRTEGGNESTSGVGTTSWAGIGHLAELPFRNPFLEGQKVLARNPVGLVENLAAPVLTGRVDGEHPETSLRESGISIADREGEQEIGVPVWLGLRLAIEVSAGAAKAQAVSSADMTGPARRVVWRAQVDCCAYGSGSCLVGFWTQLLLRVEQLLRV